MNFRDKIISRANFNRNIVFTAIILDENSKKVLLKEFPPQHKVVQDLHVTLGFKTYNFPDNLGESVTFQVYGYYNDEKIDGVSVKLNGVESKNEIPHITISTRQDTKPSYSNEIIQKGYEAVEPITLTGKIGAFIAGKGYVFKDPTIPIEPLINSTQTNQLNQDIKKPLEI